MINTGRKEISQIARDPVIAKIVSSIITHSSPVCLPCGFSVTRVRPRDVEEDIVASGPVVVCTRVPAVFLYFQPVWNGDGGFLVSINSTSFRICRGRRHLAIHLGNNATAGENRCLSSPPIGGGFVGNVTF